MIRKISSSFSIEPDLLKKAKIKALKENTTLSQIICDRIDEYVNEDKDTKQG